jgi:hypothetical protein
MNPASFSRVALRHEVRRKDGEGRGTSNGDVRPVFVRERCPAERQAINKELAKRQADEVDDRVRVYPASESAAKLAAPAQNEAGLAAVRIPASLFDVAGERRFRRGR